MLLAKFVSARGHCFELSDWINSDPYCSEQPRNLVDQTKA
jgi:hypothetical protein